MPWDLVRIAAFLSSENCLKVFCGEVETEKALTGGPQTQKNLSGILQFGSNPVSVIFHTLIKKKKNQTQKKLFYEHVELYDFLFI